MPKTKISEFSATPGNNTDIDGINIAEGCAPSGINDAIRELMSQLKDFQAGTAGDSFNGPVGTTTAAAGAFTNLSASGTFALTGDQVQISEGGTGQTTANAAFNALAPSQTSNAGKYLKTDGTNTSWDALDISTADITGTLPVANGGTGVTSSTGTGSVVLSASPTFTGTVNGASLTLSSNFTLSGGTANGVAYLNGSKVLTTGSALTFDGSVLTNAQSSATNGVLANFQNTTTNALVQFSVPGVANVRLGAPNADAIAFYTFGSGSYPEQMRLTSTGLGIGTSSPSSRLNVSAATSTIGQLRIDGTGTGAGAVFIGQTSGSIGYVHSNAGTLAFGTSTSDNNLTERMRLDSSGNLGLGVTPSAWGSGNNVLQVGYTGAINALSSTELVEFSSNYYSDASSVARYKSNGYASRYRQANSEHRWYTAPSGTAGDPISFTQAMTLTAAGDLGVGTTSPGGGSRLHVDASGGGIIRVTRLASSATAYGQLENDGTNSTLTSSAALLFNAGGSTERARFNTTGAFVLAGGTTTANGIGITFPATQSASSDANTLDDYEEGDWTPTQGAGITLVGSFSSLGKYTKIGRLVYAYGYVAGSTSIALATAGTAICAGLPFAAPAAEGQMGTMGNNATTASGAVQVSSSTIYNNNTMAATVKIFFSVTYYV